MRYTEHVEGKQHYLALTNDEVFKAVRQWVKDTTCAPPDDAELFIEGMKQGAGFAWETIPCYLINKEVKKK